MTMLRIDPTSSAPVYRQIVDGLRIQLVNGELNPGDQLPPVRRLALDFGVHFNTVAEAYRTLAEEGWLDIGRRSGAKVVARAAPDRAGPQDAASLERRLQELAAEAQSRGFTRGRIAHVLRRLAETLERS
jgi:DNA-binding transcriptional regulator YhcF (GntR family)